jgi:TfoX/Sxy family transcriptional regulator of competence genes
MAFDQDLAMRVRRLLEKQDGISERKMFGGLAFLLKGKMFCGVLGHDLVARLGAEQAQTALRRSYVRPMDFTGRPMKGYVYIAPDGLRTDRALQTFIRHAIRYTSSLSSKRDDPKIKRVPGTAKAF